MFGKFLYTLKGENNKAQAPVDTKKRVRRRMRAGGFLRHDPARRG